MTDKIPENKIKAKISKIKWVAIGLVAAMLCGLISVGAWFYYERRLAIVAKIDSPNSIYINAAHDEDIMYLDLSGIEVEENENVNHKDFVFTVSGEYISSYNLQLAYTTNNQFRYELYKAKEINNGEPLVVYHSYVDGATYNYTFDGENLEAAKIQMVPLNLNTNTYNNGSGEWLARTDDDYYHLTYGNGENNYSHYHKYAVPIYEQSENPVNVDAASAFHHYYILRVIWGAGKTNDRETDIIYISAAQGKSALDQTEP